jgi:hypothetical protein
MNAKTARVVAAAVPVVLVNAVAFAGQLAFLRDHLPWPLAAQLAMAAALESIAVYLAFHAHVAALANDSALRLRLASYGFALVIAAMNYSHFAPHWRPTFAAAAVGLMSASSPWLWGVHSRRVSRDQMMAAGLIEGHALRLGSTRWLWHPLRSARVMWFATWEGITDPREAIAAALAGPVVEPADVLPEVPADEELAALSKAEAIRLALAHNEGNVIMAHGWLQARGISCDRAYMHDVKAGRAGRRRQRRRQPLALVAGQGVSR